MARFRSIPMAVGMLLCACPLRADSGLVLWYPRPAAKWVEALPIGNGRLGAMVFGRTKEERIQLNEDTLWAGGPYDPSRPEALEALPEVRRLIFAGKYREAHGLAGEKLMARPLRQMPYQPLGDLLLTFPGHEAVADYRRELDLATGIARVRYRAGDGTFTREIFSSAVDQVIVVRLEAGGPGRIAFTAALKSPQKGTLEAAARSLIFRGTGPAARGIPGALRFQARVVVRAEGGAVRAKGDRIEVTGADAATVLVAAATSYKGAKDVTGDPEARVTEALEGALAKPYARLRADHVADYRRLFARVELDVGTTEAAKRPTDERIRRFAEGGDPQLAALYFQFGRYLLIASSRPGCQPANLQGLWNESTSPPWDSKYTININAEMNYWPAEVCNLAECHEPLLRMVTELVPTGGRTARVNYGARGWVCHHNTDLWRATAPIDGPTWGMWPTGGAWLATHLWEHYRFGGDTAFLRRVYPTMKGAARFFLDTLVEEPRHGWLVTCPSLSPEHGHPGGASICAGPTMDMQILRDLFGQVIEASEIFGIDEGFREEVRRARARLAPMQVGRHGQLQEWLEDWDDPKDHHRHVSHLYGLFPSDQITLRGTPKLAAAARRSLRFRGDGGTGWSKAWKVNLWARLEDGDHAYKLLGELISGSTLPNMFDSCPPFQIDGNFGGCSGIARMLLQSHGGEVHLLPALPSAWPEGRVTGLRARGGFTVEIAWRDGALAGAGIHSVLGRPCRLRTSAPVDVRAGGAPVRVERPGRAVVVFPTRAGATYAIAPRGG